MAQTRLSTRSEEISGTPPRCQLVVIEGPDAGRAVTLEGTRRVGTDDRCELKLSDDRVSGKHLEVSVDGSKFRVVDLDSTNGTFLEGTRVHEAVVEAGASLKLGRTVLRVLAQSQPLEVTPSQARRFGELVGESFAMREVFAVLELAARSDATVLVQGETGTGKELVARALHEASARRAGPFVAVDCGALPESLLESELFGHVKGAFTGAEKARAGAFTRAHSGTLFLDELTGVSAGVQARLLRVLEERKVKPVGSDDERAVDVRVVAASRQPLEGAVAGGAFRPDLYYRLSVLTVELPPLRSRREDLQVLVAELLKRRGFEPGPIDGTGFDRLRAHGWPGNVRELRNIIDRAVALSPGATAFRDLKISVAPATADDALTVRSDLPFKEAKEGVVDAFERRYLEDVLARHHGNVSAAARFAQLDRKYLRTLLEQHGLRGEGGDD
jgi:DNA-binding NtrC family response regulator